jgi:hypothetical protein
VSGPEERGFFGDAEVARRSEVTRRRGPSAPGPRPIRLVVLSVVLLIAIGAGVADRVVHRARPLSAAPIPVSSIAPAAVESSVWYCAGGTSALASSASTTVDLVNTTRSSVVGTMTAVGDGGATKTVALSVPGRSQIIEVPGLLVGENMVATTVDLAGGGVLVTESAAGTLGWSESACSRSTAPRWYFASGSTINGNTLTMSLYNPTATDAVVDMTFVRPGGVTQPTPFQGIVVAPGRLVVEHIDAYVQDAPSVSSVVDVRTGTIVAALLQVESVAGIHGISVRLGVPSLAQTWTLPNSLDYPGSGAATSITVFNPTASTERVEALVYPSRSPPARFADTIGPRSAWVFDTSGQTRIPSGLPFLAVIQVVRGRGVVVDRTAHAPSTLAAPQFGAVSGLPVGPGVESASIAVVPGPGDQAHPVVAGARVSALSVLNPGTATVRATVWVLDGAQGLVVLDRVTVASGSSTAIPRSVLGQAGRLPLAVSADHPVLVLADMGPTAGDGVVSLAGAGAPAL